MMRIWAVAVTPLLLGGSAAWAQTQPPNSTTLCPVTHDCRTVGQGALEKHAVPPPPVGTIQCPPGTYQVPNTNRCRVK
jgi:hypothetical protein